MGRDDDYRREMMGHHRDRMGLISPELARSISRRDGFVELLARFIGNELARLHPDVEVTDLGQDMRADECLVKVQAVLRIPRRLLHEFEDIDRRRLPFPSDPDYAEWLRKTPIRKPKPAPKPEPEQDDELDVFGPSAETDKEQEK